MSQSLTGFDFFFGILPNCCPAAGVNSSSCGGWCPKEWQPPASRWQLANLLPWHPPDADAANSSSHGMHGSYQLELLPWVPQLNAAATPNGDKGAHPFVVLYVFEHIKMTEVEKRA